MAEQSQERSFVVDGAFLRREANTAVKTFFAPIAAVVRTVAAAARPDETNSRDGAKK